MRQRLGSVPRAAGNLHAFNAKCYAAACARTSARSAFPSAGSAVRGARPNATSSVLPRPAALRSSLTSTRNMTSTTTKSATDTTSNVHHSEGGKMPFPLSLVYYTRSPMVILRRGNDAGKPLTTLTAITLINLGVFCAWIAGGEMEAEEADAHHDFMLEHFSASVHNFNEGRYHTLLTAGVSHSNIQHLFGNLTALWMFGWRSVAALGAPAFVSLYAVGSVACSAAHVAFNIYHGKTEKFPSNREIRQEVDKACIRMVKDEQKRDTPLYRKLTSGTDKEKARSEKKLRDRAQQVVFLEKLYPRDMASVGASGAIMATANGSALLFPKDLIVARGMMLPLPAAILMFTASDLMGVVNPTPADMVDHAGHMLGAAAGLAFVTARFYQMRGTSHGIANGVRGPLPVLAIFHQYKKHVVWRR